MDESTKKDFTQFLSCNFNFENNPYLKALSTTYAEIFPHRERTASVTELPSNHDQTQRKINKPKRKESVKTDSVRMRHGIIGTVNNYEKYFKIVNTKNTSKHILDTLDKFFGLKSTELNDNEQGTKDYLLGYLSTRQDTSNSIYTAKTNISSAAEAFTKSLEAYRRMSFSAGWKEHSICIQFQESNEHNAAITQSQRHLTNNELNTLTIRLFNAGEKSIRIKKEEDQIRAVTEYKKTFSSEAKKKEATTTIATALIAIYIDQMDADSAQSTIHRIINEYEFSGIAPENSQLGEFATDPQISGNCLLRSLLEEVRALMILELGVETGQELFQKFYYFCSTYTPPRVSHQNLQEPS